MTATGREGLVHPGLATPPFGPRAQRRVIPFRRPHAQQIPVDEHRTVRRHEDVAWVNIAMAQHQRRCTRLRIPPAMPVHGGRQELVSLWICGGGCEHAIQLPPWKVAAEGQRVIHADGIDAVHKRNHSPDPLPIDGAARLEVDPLPGRHRQTAFVREPVVACGTCSTYAEACEPVSEPQCRVHRCRGQPDPHDHGVAGEHTVGADPDELW